MTIETQSSNWGKWRREFSAAYTKVMKGIPIGEMKRYYKDGVPPELAAERAIARRRVHVTVAQD